jgi:hypothetical protein
MYLFPKFPIENYIFGFISEILVYIREKFKNTAYGRR